MTWPPHREPLGTTLVRTIGIAAAVGGVIAWRAHRLLDWPIASLLVLWVSLGGHWVEIAFLNGMRPRLSPSRALQIAARLGVWFVGGVGMGLAVALTMRLFSSTRGIRLPPWWAGGLAFVAIELIAHAVLAMRQRPNFYDGRG